VPVRTRDDWGEPPPGYCEADLVEHCGSEHEGSFVHSLTVSTAAGPFREDKGIKLLTLSPIPRARRLLELAL
jgi:hypothetical protein